LIGKLLISNEEYVIFNRIKVIENIVVIDRRCIDFFPRKLRKFFLLIENIPVFQKNALKFSQFQKAQNSIQPVSRRPNAI
jgi:hypothetical protein